MIDKSKILDLVNQRIVETDIFVVDISVSASNAIRVTIDADSGVSIEKCIDISRQVEHNLDREAEDFALEVTSFGLDQSFKMLRQYNKNIGRDVKVFLNDGKIVKGTLIKVSEDFIRLEKILTKKENKKNVDEILDLDLASIKETKLEISFK